MPANSNIKKVRLSLIGASGKMGKMIVDLANEDPDVEIVEDGDVIIDFSSPNGTKQAIAMQKPLVCGTTGLSDEIFNQLENLSKKVPVLYSPNFSLGIALCFEMLEIMGEKLKKTSSIKIHETHHRQKVDAPSGTALKMAKFLGVEKITSSRIGDVVGIHEVSFLLDDEKITLKHEAFSRKIYAKGALIAAKFILNKPPKLYALSECV